MGIEEWGLVTTLILIAIIAFRFNGENRGEKRRIYFKSLFKLYKKVKVEEKRDHSFSPQSLENYLQIRHISRGMICLNSGTYVAALRCEAVNYDLKNEMEQEGIDIAFERWLTQADWPMCWYIQSRPVDLSNQVNDYRRRILDLNENAQHYGEGVVQYLQQWIHSQPRFDTVRYVLFPLNLSEISRPSREGGVNSDRVSEEKARHQLLRRVRASQTALERCGIKTTLCTTDDLFELIYFAVNRHRASQLKYEEIKRNHLQAVHVSADRKVVGAKEKGGSYVQTNQTENRAG